jgi:hypothetical protein
LLIPDINYKGKSMPQIKGIAFYINWLCYDVICDHDVVDTSILLSIFF